MIGKIFNNKYLFGLTVILLVTMLLSQLSTQGEASAGSASDPLVTVSYVEDRIAELEEKIEELEANAGTPAEASPSVFKPIPFGAGVSVYFGESTQVILRSGRATAITSPAGGISDLTDGLDLASGVRIPKDHLLLVPKNDGRGFRLETDAVMMIMGDYTAVAE
jgi:hypothetical protein